MTSTVQGGEHSGLLHEDIFSWPRWGLNPQHPSFLSEGSADCLPTRHPIPGAGSRTHISGFRPDSYRLYDPGIIRIFSTWPRRTVWWGVGGGVGR